MRDRDWLRFLQKAAVTVVKYMVLGAVLMGGIGALIAFLAAIYGGGGPLSLANVAGVAWNYVRVGLFGGGLIGLLYGLLAQGSYS